MRTIAKSPEPISLARYRSTPGATYEGYPDKGTLRDCLVDEQRGLCCYCLSRIRAEGNSMKIEHRRSQAGYPKKQLAYSNLLGACKGNEGAIGRDQHCDTHKGDRDLSRNPADQTHPVGEVIQFGSDGRVSSDDPVFDKELNKVLNLNVRFLVENRKAVRDAFLEALPKRQPLTRARLDKWLQLWNGDSTSGDLEEYCQVVVYWLRKRLKRQ